MLATVRPPAGAVGPVSGRVSRFHWSSFGDGKAAAKFIRWAVKNGFKHDTKASGADDDGEYRARLFHVGTTRQRELSWHSITLNRAAEDHGGSYDGWETKVVK